MIWCPLFIFSSYCVSINVLLPWWDFLAFSFSSCPKDVTGTHTLGSSQLKSGTRESSQVLLRTQDGTWMFHDSGINWITSVCPSIQKILLDACGPCCDFHRALLKYQHRAADKPDRSLNQWMHFKPASIFFSVIVWIYNNTESSSTAVVGEKNKNQTKSWIKYRQRWGNNIFKFQCLHKSIGEPPSSL